VTAIWNFGSGLKALFGAVSSDSVSLSEKLLDLSVKFKQWATDSETLTTVTNLFRTFRDVAGTALDYVNRAIGAFSDGWSAAEEKVSGEGNWLDVFRGLGEQAAAAWKVIDEDLLPALASLGDVLLNDVLPPLTDVATEVKDTFLKALGEFADFVKDDVVPALRDDLAPVLRDDIVPAVRWLADLFETKLIPTARYLADILEKTLKPA
nr:hypothetical protein [Micromonospora sp. DSM 115978]